MQEALKKYAGVNNSSPLIQPGDFSHDLLLFYYLQQIYPGHCL